MAAPGGGSKGSRSASISSTLWDTSKVPKDKVLFADNQSLETQEDCTECAARLKQDMLRRYTSAEFDAVAILGFRLATTS
jgi:hypothetical protein